MSCKSYFRSWARLFEVFGGGTYDARPFGFPVLVALSLEDLVDCLFGCFLQLLRRHGVQFEDEVEGIPSLDGS